jgi:hypothetical protein
MVDTVNDRGLPDMPAYFGAMMKRCEEMNEILYKVLRIEDYGFTWEWQRLEIKRRHAEKEKRRNPGGRERDI